MNVLMDGCTIYFNDVLDGPDTRWHGISRLCDYGGHALRRDLLCSVYVLMLGYDVAIS